MTKKIKKSRVPDFAPALGLVVLVLVLFVFSSDIKNAYAKWFYPVASVTNELVNGLENGAEVVGSFTGHGISLLKNNTKKLTSLSLTLPQISFPKIEIAIPKPDLSFVQHSMLHIAASAGNTAISFFSFFNSGMETMSNLAKDV
ncbi:hypothetical protein KJ750_00720, partial [Patescibacteria group bacterium]|nr:hypothetical protein [Patescibacteria group bacterium]